ncbi:MAG: NAD(P)-dependent oxidoreductase, partial [Planctomyces sp.]
IELVRDLVEPTAELGFGEVPYRPDQVMRMHVSVERLANAARFSPQVDLADGLKQSVAKSRASSRQEK